MRRLSAIALATVFGLVACGEAEMDEVPETAEVEPGDEIGELELDEELVLGVDDIGEDIMATGWVSGLPLPNGFFLRTEDNRVIFVESTEQVAAGDVVRVVGPLVATQAAVFEGWETDAFDPGFEAEWDVETIAYIDALVVTPMGPDSSEGEMRPSATDTTETGAPGEDTGGPENDDMGGGAAQGSETG